MLRKSKPSSVSCCYGSFWSKNKKKEKKNETINSQLNHYFPNTLTLLILSYAEQLIKTPAKDKARKSVEELHYLSFLTMAFIPAAPCYLSVYGIPSHIPLKSERGYYLPTRGV